MHMHVRVCIQMRVLKFSFLPLLSFPLCYHDSLPVHLWFSQNFIGFFVYAPKYYFIKMPYANNMWYNSCNVRDVNMFQLLLFLLQNKFTGLFYLTFLQFH
jgi:hypothetical protein